MSDMKLSATYRVTKIHKRTTAELFNNLNVGDILHIDLEIRTTGKTYGYMPNVIVGTSSAEREISVNSLRRVLLNFDIEKV